MSVRKEIMALPRPRKPQDDYDAGFEIGLEKAADIAERRERELVEQGIQMSDRIQFLEDSYSHSAQFHAKLLAERDELIAKVEALIVYVDIGGTECNGYKCRNLNCYSCFSEETVQRYVEKGRQALAELQSTIHLLKEKK